MKTKPTSRNKRPANSPSNHLPERWEVKELGELGIFSKGKGILKEQLSESGLPCIRYGEIYTTHDFIVRKFHSFISEKVAKESQEIKKGDILFAGSGETLEEIGKAVAYVGEEEAYAGGDVVILSTNGAVNPECLSYALETVFVRKQKRKIGQGHSVVHVYADDLATIKIPLPPLPEQRTIASCLSVWDKAIEKTQQLSTQKQLRKKWLMQMLLTGKKRLKGFKGEWKEYSLKQLVNIRGRVGWKGYTQDDLRREGPLTIGAKHINDDNKLDLTEPTYLSREKFEESPEIMVTQGDILIVQRGSLGKVALIKENIGEATINPSMVILRCKGDVHSPYLFFQLAASQIQKIITGESSSTGVPMISQMQIGNFKIYLPSLNEQQEITAILNCSDREIQLLNEKLEKLKEQKKGLMQVLLTGKKRLNH